MKKAVLIVWVYAVIFNAYFVWIWARDLLRTGLGIPHSPYTAAIFLGLLVNVIALLLSPRQRDLKTLA